MSKVSAPDKTMKEFRISFGNNAIIGDLLPGNAPSRLLVLHGGGAATGRHTYLPLRNALFNSGITSCSFDFIGHGETGGDLIGTHLKERTDQARAVVSTGVMESNYAILAASMSGYTAIKLLETEPVNELVLIVPAAYSRDAYSIPFGPEFSKSIRYPRSWENSDAWEILQNFTGRLLVIAAEHDEVVPLEIAERFLISAPKSIERKLYIIPGSSHKVLDFLSGNNLEREIVVGLIRDFLFGGVTNDNDE